MQKKEANMFQLGVSNTVFLLVDVQKNLVPAMDKKVYSEKLKNMKILLEGAKILNVPVVYTEQYPKGLGETVDELKDLLKGATYYEKVTFSCCGNRDFLEEFNKEQLENIVVFGMETHICVLQTVLDLLDMGLEVYVVKDAVQSRKKENWETGLHFMSEAGAMLTSTEIVLFQLLKKAKTDEFKAISKLIK